MTENPKVKFLKKKASRPNNLQRDLDAAIIVYHQHKNTAKALNEQIAETSEFIISVMDKLGYKSHTVTGEDGTIHKATFVQAMRVGLDEASLKTKVGATMWRKITTLVLDKRKLDAFVKSGEIDPMVVASVTTEEPNKPFIKIT